MVSFGSVWFSVHSNGLMVALLMLQNGSDIYARTRSIMQNISSLLTEKREKKMFPSFLGWKMN